MQPGAVGELHAPVRERARSPWRFVLAAVIYVAVAVAVFAPLVGAFRTGFLTAEATDARNAARWLWAIAHLHSTPFTLDHDPFNGAPEGTPLVPAVYFASPFQPLLLWLGAAVGGPILAINGFLLLGVVATAIATFVFLDRLGFEFTASLVGGYVVSMNPWEIERAVAGAPAFNHGWCLIVLFAALLNLLERPGLRSAVLAGAAYALCFAVAAYLGLVALPFVVAYCLVEITRRGIRTHELLTIGRNVLVMAGVTAVVLIPAAIVYLSHRDTASQTLDNPVNELNELGAAPFASYLLPSPRNPVLGGLAHSLHPRDPLREKVMYFGYTTMVLAAVGLVLLFRRNVFRGRARTALTLAAVSAPVAWAFSLPRTVSLLGVDLYTPAFVIGHVTSYYRVYARVGYAAGIALTILAVGTLSRLELRRHGNVLVLLIGLVIAFEFLPGTLPVARADRPPAYDTWLAKQPKGIVAHYPLPTDNELALILAGDEYYNQRFTGLPTFALFGAGIGGTREQGIRLLARYITDKLTPKILEAEGVRYVALHDDIYRKLHQDPPPLGPPFRHLRTIGDVRIYELTPRPDPHYLDKLLLRQAPTIAALEGLQFGTVEVGPDGFLSAERYHNVFGWRWMTQAGGLHIHNPYEHTMKFRLFAHAFSNTTTRTIEVDSADGTKITSFRVPPYERGLALKPIFVPPGDTQINLIAEPGPEPLGLKDSRVASIFLGPVRAVPLPTVSLRKG